MRLLAVLIGFFATCIALPANSTTDEIQVPPGTYSTVGFVMHLSNNILVSPEWIQCPKGRFSCTLGSTQELEFMQFRFYQIEGHLGFFEQNCGNTVIQPDRDFAVVNTGRTTSSLYYLDEERQLFVNYDGRHLITQNDFAYPVADTYLFMSDHATPFSRFTFRPKDGGSLYPTPTVSGRWMQRFAVFDPSNTYSQEIEFKVGAEYTKQTSVVKSWKFQAGAAYEWFKGNAELSYAAEITDALTWYVEAERTYTVQVVAGKSIVTWQYVLEAERFGEIYTFQTSIMADTSSNTPPVFS